MHPTFGYHPAAAAEVEAVMEWYRSRNPVAAERFLTELDRAMILITDTPKRWPMYGRNTRRFVLRRFPFSIIYRERSSRVEVVAVAHARRLPGYWKDRLR